MTKELVKSENGHKIIKHAMPDRSHSLCSGPRIRMRFTTPFLIIVLLAVAAVNGDSTISSTEPQPVSSEKPDGTREKNTQNGSLNTSSSTERKVPTKNNIPNDNQAGKSGNNDNDNLSPDKEDLETLQEIMLLESLLNEEADDDGDDDQDEDEGDTDKIITDYNRNTYEEKNADSDGSSVTPFESKVSKDFIDIRRQGEINPDSNQENSVPDTQTDDRKKDETSNQKSRPGETTQKSRQPYQDGFPVLELTQGGYERPFKLPTNRYMARSDSSEQSTNPQGSDRTLINSGQTNSRRVEPQVTYSSQLQPFYPFRPAAILNQGFGTPARNTPAINNFIPTAPTNSFFNHPAVGYSDFPSPAFQTPFPQNSDAGSFNGFVGDPSGAALYQESQRNPFQTPGILFHAAPQIQQPRPLMDPSRNVQPQFQSNPFIPYPSFENSEDSSTPNYFRNTPASNPFQLPPNFYRNAPNRINTPSNPPISFLSNYPNVDDRLSSQFYRYPVRTNPQNDKINSDDQQPDSDASKENKTPDTEEQQTGKSSNRDSLSSLPFGTRIPIQNDENVYMNYPRSEAGYATEENLPSENGTKESNGDIQESNVEQRNFPNTDPYKNAIDSLRSNQKINNSFDYPPVLYGTGPIDFGYQRPQSNIFYRNSDTNSGVPQNLNSNFESRNPFDPLPSLPEENYLFLDVENQLQEPNKTPSCARKTNASVCFDDEDYPRNDIMYALNSNSFLVDRLTGPDIPFSSIVFVERNVSESEKHVEKYACSSDILFGAPLRLKNAAGDWRIIVNILGKLVQPIRMEKCKSLGDFCNYGDAQVMTTCVQKNSLQRLLVWSRGRGIYSDVFMIPVACSCQLIEFAET